MTWTRWADIYSERAKQFTDPLDICEFYANGRHYDEAWFDETTGRLRELLKLGGESRVLEVGCGCAVLMKRLLPHVREMVGVDLSPGVLDVARRELPGIMFHVAPAERLPLTDGSFDACFAYQVAHYFESLEAARCAVLEMKRVVRSGGRVVLGQVPNADRETEYQQLRATRNVPRDRRVDHSLRWLWYSPDFFRELTNHFTDVRIEQHVRESDPASPYRMDVVFHVG